MTLQIPTADLARIADIQGTAESVCEGIANGAKYIYFGSRSGSDGQADPGSGAVDPLWRACEYPRSLYNLYYVREFSGVRLDDLIQGINESARPELVSQDGTAGLLRERLEALLGIDSLRLASKAIRLQCDGERLY